MKTAKPRLDHLVAILRIINGPAIPAMLRPFVTRACSHGREHPVQAVLLALAVIAVLAIYVYRVAFWPRYDFDELGFLNIPYRFVHFGDLRYPVFLDADGFNSEPIRKYPPIVGGWLRSLMHAVFGFSAVGSRIFSGLLMVATALLAVMLLLRMKVGLTLATAAFLFIALQPSVILAARTVRLEQEIIFLSIAAISIPLLLGARAPKFSWTLSGFAAAWAGLSHPWGLSIGVGLFIAIVLMPACWRQHDGLSWSMRCGFLAMGAAAPALLTLYAVFHDWPRYREYVEAQASLYAIRNVQNVEFFRRIFPDSWASTLFPPYWAAKIDEFNHYAAKPPAGYQWVWVLSALLWAQVALVAAFLLTVLRKRLEAPDLPPIVFACATAGVMGMFFFYPPSTNYYAYPAVMIPITATLVLAWCWSRDAGARVRRGLRTAASVTIGVGILATAHVFLHRLELVRNASAAVPLDRYFDAQDAMGRRLGFKSTARAYCDMATWMACGRDMRSALQATILAPAPVPDNAAAASFHQPLFGELVNDFPSLTTPSLTRAEKIERVRQLTSNLRLAGLIRVPQGLDLYFVNEPPQALSVVTLDLTGQTTTWMAQPLDERNCAWQRLDPARYLVVRAPEAVTPPVVTVAPASRDNGRREIPWIGGAHLERAAFVDLDEPSSLDACSGDTAPVRLFRLGPAASS
jgi:4-amino-4-deoxy-L-arabinose transferase-like glycosyltransferase